MSFALNFTLNSCVVNFANLFRVESCPLLIIECLIEQLDVLQIDEVYEGISYIAFIEKIYGKIKKVELIFEFSVYGCEHLLFCIFIGNVPDH